MSDAPIIFDDVTMASGATIDCRIAAGQRVRIICDADDARAELSALLAGMTAPRRGHVRYLGRDIYSMNENELLSLHRRVGIVSRDGGLISNLKGWENVILPMWYHDGRGASALEEQAAAFFHALGFTNERLHAFLGLLPERMSAQEERSIALVRTWLMEPEIIIYDAPFSGLERGVAARWLDVTHDFHRRGANRVSVYLLPDEPFSERVEADKTVMLKT